MPLDNLPSAAGDSEEHRSSGVPTMMAAVVVALTMLAIGGVHPVVGSLFALASGASLGFLLVKHRGGAVHVPLPSFALAAVAVYTLLQCVPLPASVVRLLSPRAADVWARALLPLGEAAPSLATLSLSPEITMVEAAKYGAYAAICYVAFRWARTRGSTQFATAVLVLACAVGLITVAHGLLGVDRVFGVYTTTIPFPRWRVGPLLNANHLSALLMFGAFCGVARLVSESELQTGRTALLLAATTGLVLGVVVLASRSAVATLVCGGLFVPVVATTERKNRSRRQITRGTLSLVVSAFVVGSALALFGFREDIFQSLGERDISKLVVARDSLPLIKDHLLFGIGRGAFETVFFAYKSVGRHEFWTHPENIVVQWIAEWGAPVALVLFATLCVSFYRAWLTKASAPVRVLALGLVVLAAQNLLDYNLELSGMGALAAAALGTVCGGSHPKPSRDDDPRGPVSYAVPLRLVALFAASLCALSTLALLRNPSPVSALRRTAYAQLSARRSEAPDPGAYRSLFLRFPADPYIALTGAVSAARVDPRKSIPWYNRALERGPRLGVTHFSLAETLGALGLRSQALLEVRLALAYSPELLTPAVQLVARLARDASDVLRIADEVRGVGDELVERLALQLPPESPMGATLTDAVLQRSPCAVALRLRLVRSLIAKLSSGASPCDGDRGRVACRELITPEISKIALCPSGDGLSQQVSADLQWALGERRAALVTQDAACLLEGVDLTSCLQSLVERAAVARETERVKKHVRTVVSRRCQDPEACATAWTWAASVYTTAGDHPSAYVAATKASEALPGNVELKVAMAGAAMRAGARERAEAILMGVLARQPEHAVAAAELAKLRGADKPAVR